MSLKWSCQKLFVFVFILWWAANMMRCSDAQSLDNSGLEGDGTGEETGTDGDSDGDADADVDGDGDSDGDSDGDADGDSDGDGDGDSDGDADDEIIDCIDVDGDWWCETFDCDDQDPLINPGAVDIPENGIDENCDGVDAVEVIDTDSEAAHCGFVDILFVLDNSVSMQPAHVELAKAFPLFVDAMFGNLQPGTDLHVGITTTSFDTKYDNDANIECRSTTPQSIIESHFINPLDENTGENGGQGRLFEWEGKTYFAANTSDSPQNLKDWFSAAAQAVGDQGSTFEMPAAAAGFAAHEINNQTNDGFLRDEETALVIFILSDEPDKSVGDLSFYTDMLIKAKEKCGGAKCIATAGIIDPCVDNTQDTLWKFMTAFGDNAPLYEDIYMPENYPNIVGDALAGLVEETCDAIIDIQ